MLVNFNICTSLTQKKEKDTKYGKKVIGWNQICTYSFDHLITITVKPFSKLLQTIQQLNFCNAINFSRFQTTYKVQVRADNPDLLFMKRATKKRTRYDQIIPRFGASRFV